MADQINNIKPNGQEQNKKKVPISEKARKIEEKFAKPIIKAFNAIEKIVVPGVVTIFAPEALPLVIPAVTIDTKLRECTMMPYTTIHKIKNALSGKDPKAKEDFKKTVIEGLEFGKKLKGYNGQQAPQMEDGMGQKAA